MWKTSLTSSRFGYLIPLIIIKCSRCYFHNYRNSKSNFYLISLIYIMFLENALVAIMIPSFVFNSLGWEYIITFTTYHTLYFPCLFFHIPCPSHKLSGCYVNFFVLLDSLYQTWPVNLESSVQLECNKAYYFKSILLWFFNKKKWMVELSPICGRPQYSGRFLDFLFAGCKKFVWMSTSPVQKRNGVYYNLHWSVAECS